MKRVGVALLVLLVMNAVYAKIPTPPPQAEDMLKFDKHAKIYREGTEWTDTWIPQSTSENKPYVLLIGDSITRQYQGNVTKGLRAKANTGYVATSLAIADPLYPVLLSYVLGLRHYDVIHLNNGLHGPAYNEKQYEEGYEKAIKLIMKYQPKAKLVLVLSTPLKDGSDNRFQKAVAKRNEIVRKLAKKYKLPVDDLFTIVEHKNELHKDKFHFNSKGVSILAEKVMESVKALLKH